MSIKKRFTAAAAVLLIGLFWSIPIALAQDGISILRIAGKAEILDQGRRTEAKEGQFLAPGQSVRLIGGGEVSLSAANGRIQVRVRDSTAVRYDGEVGSNSQPWISDTRYQRASEGEGKRVPQLSVPVGRLEVEVQPGQEMRVVCPLIMAAVRGTRFTVDVSLDGTSRVDTFEGAVATYGRNGEISLTMPGHSAEVTARQYASFLAGRGVISPGGNWKNVPPRTQERVDNDSLGTIFREGGGSLLVAVLANPNASPTSGVNALAVESSSIETGSLFVEGSLVSGGAAGGSGLASPADSSGVLPDSSLLDQGLPNIQNPYVPHSGQTAYYHGFFTLPTSTNTIFNKLVFDLDLGDGRITHAGFDIEYESTYGPFTLARTIVNDINNYA
jgi:hypothetical protein